jgi:hypothetical protein
VGQEMAWNALLPSTLVTVHVPLDGAVDVTTSPALSTATHRSVGFVVHEMPEIVWFESIPVIVQALLPPVGLVEIAAPPPPSVATHNELLGQETACSPIGLEKGA